MSNGSVVAIFIGAESAGPMQAVDAVKAEAGLGLVGDRYWQEGLKARKTGPDREITLIESEAIEAVNRDEEIAFEPVETRRNLVTRGVALNHLVGREFQVGALRLKGLRLCEPCGHLEKLTRPGVRLAFLHRGGLRAQILQGGEVKVGDAVTIPAES